MSGMNKNYVVYHLHSDLSNGVTNIDSVTKYKEYVEYAKSLGMTALAFAEHGNIFEWVHKKESIEAAEMKYIHLANLDLFFPDLIDLTACFDHMDLNIGVVMSLFCDAKPVRLNRNSFYIASVNSQKRPCGAFRAIGVGVSI